MVVDVSVVVDVEVIVLVVDVSVVVEVEVIVLVVVIGMHSTLL